MKLTNTNDSSHVMHFTKLINRTQRCLFVVLNITIVVITGKVWNFTFGGENKKTTKTADPLRGAGSVSKRTSWLTDAVWIKLHWIEADVHSDHGPGPKYDEMLETDPHQTDSHTPHTQLLLSLWGLSYYIKIPSNPITKNQSQTKETLNAGTTTTTTKS